MATPSFLLLIILSTLAHTGLLAYEEMQEFHSLTESEAATNWNPKKHNGEYQSDIISYHFSPSWQYRWHHFNNGYTISAGSLDKSHFAIINRFKWNAELLPNLNFRFLYLEQGSFERNIQHQIIEFQYFLIPKVSLSLYGEPSLYKRKDDIGGALSFLLPELEVRLYYTLVDYPRQLRNDRNDYYEKGYEPTTFGVTARWTSGETDSPEEGSFFEFAFRKESKTKWIFPDEKSTFLYEKQLVSLHTSYFLLPSLQILFRLQLDQSKKMKEFDISALQENYSHQVKRELFQLGIKLHQIFGLTQNIRFGLDLANRAFHNNQDLIKLSNKLPFVAWQTNLLPSRKDLLTLRYQFNLYQEDGKWTDKKEPTNNPTTEHRFNVNYEFSFSPTSSLLAQVTFDVDEMVQSINWNTERYYRGWDGGNIQLSIAK